MADKRFQGSTIAAYVCGGGLIVLAGALVAKHQGWIDIDWNHCRFWVNVGSCLLFGAVLLMWAQSKTLSDGNEHHLNSATRIGFETVTMIVGVVTAVIAILTLTHGT